MKPATTEYRIMYERARQLIDGLFAKAVGLQSRRVRERLDEIRLVPGVCEPGYDDTPAALGNWNTIDDYDAATKTFINADDTMGRACKALERMGWSIEWCDEWAECDGCGRIFRVVQTSYSWQKSGTDYDGVCLCGDCIDPRAHLRDLEGRDNSCNTIERIDPSDYGYRQVCGKLENGFHGGQCDNPRLIGAALRAAGVTRYLFNLDSTGQFDLAFSVWVRTRSDNVLARAENAVRAAARGPDPAIACQNALKAATVEIAKLPDVPGVRLATCHADGTATARLVSPQEFVEGIKS